MLWQSRGCCGGAGLDKSEGLFVNNGRVMMMLLLLLLLLMMMTMAIVIMMMMVLRAPHVNI